MKKLSAICLAVFLSGTFISAQAQQKPLKLWYDKPAEKWTDALPIGNGSLGAMIYGGAASDHIQFNEQTLWTGSPRKYQRDGAANYLPKIRQLLFDGKQAEAEVLAGKYFLGTKDHELTYSADSLAWVKKMLLIKTPAEEKFNDANWKAINLPTEQGWEKTDGFDGVDGAVWFRTTFDKPANWTGDVVLNLGRIRDADITYVNGKKVGETSGTTYRKYIIPASQMHAGLNTIAVQVFNFNDKGGFTSNPKELNLIQLISDKNVPISLAHGWKYWIQDTNPPVFPSYEASYQPFGDLFLNFANKGEVSNYKRSLDVKTAVANVSYTQNGVNFTREYISSSSDKAIAIHLKADKAGQINFDALFASLHKMSAIKQVDGNTIRLTVQVSGGALKGTAYLYADVKNGKVSVAKGRLHIADADEATLYLVAATNFKNYKDVSGDPDAICKQRLQNIKTKTYTQIAKAHIADYQRYFNKFNVDLGSGKNESLPTDERIRLYNPTDDPSLLSLYMQYARYLLISCSRPDSQLPANLQGIWNDQITPPWGSKYTTNINLQMNYWSAEQLNLTDLNKPLFSMISQLSQAGKATAKIHYNAPGWVLHHNTDIWLGTAPINASNHGIWQTGGAWLCRHLWEHYLFTQDKAFLQKAYPEMKGAAEFFVSTLVKDPKTGYLISTPSNSPEHGGLVAGPTMDRQIIRDLFKNCIAASQVLHIDEAFRKVLEEKYKQIAPNQIGKYGQLQEWMEDKDDTADTHRHVSHLWGVFPGTDITWDGTPTMMHAAEKSFQYRGDDGTGWSLAWKVNLMARFKHGDHAMLLVNKLLSVAENGSAKERGGVYHNLFDAHPPFQIDGNFGGAAGIAEMLVQSQAGYIELLPALPTALPNGELKGICTRGGFVLNLVWKDGKLTSLDVISKTGNTCTIKYNGLVQNFKTIKGKVYHFDANLKAI
ncbi:glycoside hydrolase family 95 protein [Mucilaginibacter sp. HMF5004]|uniref:glycoside hydrolase family 95 protein n=1 Tax=Mucilaginibacter rivuli TaxID=2857527 RepID=UPI001C5E43C2|nr:glycoside hydrolase family 95 protein [Mucilaginibacter rivuli]MBW4889006.1 glycoside hydrolase family 95 protein [Mucilaginibacter rivuli]